MTPLRVFKEGSVLNVIASEGDWYRIGVFVAVAPLCLA
jgi:hypothetical protein